MRHGYTNSTELIDDQVIKTYRGPRRDARRRAEQAALRGLLGRFPVPRLVSTRHERTVTAFVDGRHGQDLIADGHAAAVLSSCGTALRRLQQIEVGVVFGAGEGVIVHGDFGPNNALFTPDATELLAMLDWEHCRPGDRVEDLSWCEWIVRMHHPTDTDALPALFAAYGWEPSWEVRHAAMVRRCRELEAFCREWDDDGAGVRRWQEHAARTRAWTA